MGKEIISVCLSSLEGLAPSIRLIRMFCVIKILLLTWVFDIVMQGTASTLTRGEVRGGGRKPYKQKGTGNARQGTRRTPLRPGGGISFGPKPRDWTIGMNKKEKRLALATAIQSAAEDMIVVEDFASDFGEIKKIVSVFIGC